MNRFEMMSRLTKIFKFNFKITKGGIIGGEIAIHSTSIKDIDYSISDEIHPILNEFYNPKVSIYCHLCMFRRIYDRGGYINCSTNDNWDKDKGDEYSKACEYGFVLLDMKDMSLFLKSILYNIMLVSIDKR